MLMSDDVASDLRFLTLAELYEDAYERFVRDVALRVVEDEATRAHLLRLAAPDQTHAARILAERQRIEATLGPGSKSMIIMGALLDVVDVERAARNFYLSALGELHDPKLAALFRELAHEEGEHTEIAEGILREAKAALPASASKLEAEDLAALGEEGPLLREGVLDFGMPGKPPFEARPRYERRPARRDPES